MYDYITMRKIRNNNKKHLQYKYQIIQYESWWQKLEENEQDHYVWVQIWPKNSWEIPYPSQNWIIRELQLAFPLIDRGVVEKLRLVYIAKYIGAIIKLL